MPKREKKSEHSDYDPPEVSGRWERRKSESLHYNSLLLVPCARHKSQLVIIAASWEMQKRSLTKLKISSKNCVTGKGYMLSSKCPTNASTMGHNLIHMLIFHL